MNRSILPLIALAIFCMANGLDAQQKDPTDVLFEEILGEAITSKPNLKIQPQAQIAVPTRQIPTGPAVQRNWGTAQIVNEPPQVSGGSFVKPTFQTPAHQASTPYEPPAATASSNRKSVSGSVAMELIAPREINLNQTATIRVQLQNTGARKM